VPGYWSESHIFSDAELRGLIKDGGTVYFLRRIEYTDSTGTWWTDRCDHIQRLASQLYFRVNHRCLAFQTDRYRAR
jgi:hypothetical protein